MTYYAGPTKTRMNPHLREEADYYDPGQTTYIVEDTDPEKNRVWAYTSFGSIMELGDVDEFRHGWDGPRYLGTFRCIGVVHTDGRTEGDVPARRLPHWVAK
jgi:hypothetical protein